MEPPQKYPVLTKCPVPKLNPLIGWKSGTADAFSGKSTLPSKVVPFETTSPGVRSSLKPLARTSVTLHTPLAPVAPACRIVSSSVSKGGGHAGFVSAGGIGQCTGTWAIVACTDPLDVLIGMTVTVYAPVGTPQPSTCSANRVATSFGSSLHPTLRSPLSARACVAAKPSAVSSGQRIDPAIACAGVWLFGRNACQARKPAPANTANATMAAVALRAGL
jgi:hypothetical protein